MNYSVFDMINLGLVKNSINNLNTINIHKIAMIFAFYICFLYLLKVYKPKKTNIKTKYYDCFLIILI